ncbi:MAG: ABC transporter permease [candidate division NC10 bacterium]|nr:ABC transporter permease [candidate division NC10 bacterium]
MEANQTRVETAAAVGRRVPTGLPMWLQAVVRFTRQKPLGTCGAAVVVVMVLVAIGADYLAPYDPLTTRYHLMMQAPGAKFWLGTDIYGRDILSRIIYGSRTALLVGFSASIFGATVGAIMGVMSAYFGGKSDLVIQRVMDVLLSFPLIVLALAVVAALGTGVENVIIAIAVPMVPRCARVVRSSALAIRETPYVDAARAMGFSHMRIMFRHMLPNVVAPYLIMLTAFLGQAILLEASLSFLGLGVTEPTPAWGLMLKGAAVEFAERAPWMGIFPGLAISAAVFGFNLFGDSLRDVLDPKLRTS